MNTLTKVFIVLLSIFSITFTMMTVQFSMVQPNWKDQAEKWKSIAQMTDTHYRNLVATKNAEAAKAAADRRAWEQQRNMLQQELAAQQEALSDSNARLAKAEADIRMKDATLEKLTAELGVAQTGATLARDHRESIEKRNIELEKANLDLNDRNNENIATIIVLEQQVRQQEQAVNLLKSERDKLLKQLRLRSAGVEESTVTLPTDKVRASTMAHIAAIRGQVQELSGDYASISVGSDDGVEMGMVFIIYNDQGYLGDLEVQELSPTASAGKLKNINGHIGIGSLVVEESGYLAMN